MREFTKILLSCIIVSVGRFLRGQIITNLFTPSLNPNSSSPSILYVGHAFVARGTMYVSSCIRRILCPRSLTEVGAPVVERVVVPVIRNFAVLATENQTVHLDASFGPIRCSGSVKTPNVRVPSSNPTPLREPSKILGIDNSVLISRQRNIAVRFFNWLNNGMPLLRFSGHLSSCKGLLVFSHCLIFISLLLPPLAFSQNPSVIQPNCTFGFSFTAIGRSTTFQNITPGVSTKTCTSWTMVYSSVGFSTLSIELDTAPDAGATPGVSPGSWTIWPSAQIAAGQTLPSTATTSSGITVFGFFPWVSVNLNSVTGTGTVTGVVYGWQTQGSQESNTGATQTQGIAPAGSIPTVGNPVQIAPNAPTKPWDCGLSGLAATLTQCQALPTAGRLYITDITVDTTTATAGTYAIEYGTGANCGTGTTKLYPSVNGPAAWTAPVLGAPQKINFQTPLQPAALNAICVIGTATNTINVEIEGFVAP